MILSSYYISSTFFRRALGWVQGIGDHAVPDDVFFNLEGIKPSSLPPLSFPRGSRKGWGKSVGPLLRLLHVERGKKTSTS